MKKEEMASLVPMSVLIRRKRQAKPQDDLFQILYVSSVQGNASTNKTPRGEDVLLCSPSKVVARKGLGTWYFINSLTLSSPTKMRLIREINDRIKALQMSIMGIFGDEQATEQPQPRRSFPINIPTEAGPKSAIIGIDYGGREWGRKDKDLTAMPTKATEENGKKKDDIPF